MTCGCTLKKDELRSINKTLRCPNHNDRGIEYVDLNCARCGEKMIRTKGPYFNVTCEKCKKERRNAMDRKYYKIRKKRPNVEKEIVIKNIDLSLYVKGLSAYI